MLRMVPLFLRNVSDSPGEERSAHAAPLLPQIKHLTRHSSRRRGYAGHLGR